MQLKPKKKARNTFINWTKNNQDKIANSQKKLDIEKDIATPFFKVRIRKYQINF